MKMTDSMQFGPEWLRNLSQHDNDNTMVMPKYQLAEHRYGREEMLALFDKSVAAPEPLRSISGLYVEKIQLPLALIQMSEEETRIWNSNATHDTNLRGLAKTIPGNMTNISPMGGGPGLARGRGTSVDRGRGRGTRGPYHYNNRNYSEDTTDSSHPNTTFGRPRIFDRSQSHTSERNWTERNGNAEYNDWNGYTNNVENGLSTSPRKDFGSTMRTTTTTTTSREDTNWRRRPAKDDDDSWRSTRHGRAYTNWREGGERDREKEKDQDGPEPGKDRRWISRVVSMHVSGHPNRRNSESREDSLPEWATESPSEGGGSFDSSGAFHGSNSDDDEHDRKNKSINELDKISNKRDDRKIDENRVMKLEQKLLNDQKKNKVKEKAHSPSINESAKSKDHDLPKLNSKPSPTSSSLIHGESPNLNNSQNLSQHLQKSIIQSQSPVPTSGDKYSNLHANLSKEIPNALTDPLKSSQTQKLQHDMSHAQAQGGIDIMNSSRGGYDSDFSMNHNENNPILSMNVSNYQNLPNSNTNNLESKLLMPQANIVNNTVTMMNSKENLEHSKSASIVNPLNTMHGFNIASSNIRMKSKEEDLDGIVVDVVSKIMEEEGNVDAIKRLENINKWYYRDPQGCMQGPFTSAEMAEWYKLGYFHDKSLLVRRACETQYYPLHDLVTLYNGAPFDIITLQNINHYRPPPPAASLGSTPNAVPSMNMPPDDLLYYQQQLQFRSLLARQQQDLAVQNAVRHLSQSDRWKTLTHHEQQRLIVQHVNSVGDVNVAAIPQVTVPQSSVPIIPNYVHPPMQQNVPASNPALVLLLSQMQQQQQQHQQQHQQQQTLQQQMLHQQLQHQQQQVQPQTSNQDVKQDRIPTNLLHQLDPLQQLVVKMNMQNSNQTSVVQPQGGNMQQVPLPNTVSQSTTAPSTAIEDAQSNPIHNLLKQLGVSTEKPVKVDSVWGPSTTTTPSAVPLINNNNAFNPQHWLSQVGRIGPASTPINNGLWTTDGVPPMKTEQQIIESLMKDEKHEDTRKEMDNSGKLLELKKQEEIRLHQEELLRKTAVEKKKKQKEDEKRMKQLQEEEALRKLEEEKRKKAVEDAKRKEEERRRKEDEKRRKEEEKEKKKVDDDKKKQEQKHKETEEVQRKQAESLRRLKEQQLHASGGNKSSLKSIPSSTNDHDQNRPIDSVPKIAKQNSTLSNKSAKSQSSDENRKQNAEVNRSTDQERQTGNKQISKSKSSPSVPTQQNQKSGESEKKEKKKKEKAPVSAWADQKKVTNVKSLAEIQAEEQKQLAKQIEREKAERLLQQQQAAAAAALAAKENASGNIWNSQSVPWKNSPTWASPSPPAPAALANSRSEQSVPSKGWNEPSRAGSTTANNTTVTKSQPNTASTSNTNRSVSNSINSSTSQQQKAVTTNAAKTKPKKEDSKKAAPAVTVATKNDELSKWGVKTLSGLKPAVDIPTFITFLRDVEDPGDVMEYATDYLGDGKEAKNFVKQFLEKRSVLVSGLSGSVIMSSSSITSVAGVKKSKKKPEDNGSSASKSTTKQPASKQNSMEFTEVKGKVKKGRKKQIMRVDNALLGFNVTAAADRINIGDRDCGDEGY